MIIATVDNYVQLRTQTYTRVYKNTSVYEYSVCVYTCVLSIYTHICSHSTTYTTHVSRVSHACDTHGPFKLWVICTVYVYVYKCLHLNCMKPMSSWHIPHVCCKTYIMQLFKLLFSLNEIQLQSIPQMVMVINNQYCHVSQQQPIYLFISH